MTKNTVKALKEIEETTLLISCLLLEGVDLASLCACLDLECQECIINDQNLFSDKKIRDSLK